MKFGYELRVVISRSKENGAGPIEATLEVKACFKPVGLTTLIQETTPMETTTGGVKTTTGEGITTTGGVEETTTGIELTTTRGVKETTTGMELTTTGGVKETTTGIELTTTGGVKETTISEVITTRGPCSKVDGMDDESFIPDGWLSATSGVPENLRPNTAEKWRSTPTDSSPSITVDLLNTPSSNVFVDGITLRDLQNVRSFMVKYYTDDDFVPSEQQVVEVCNLSIDLYLIL